MMRSKNLIVFVFCCTVSVASFAQGLLNNGAHIVMNGAASNIYIDGAAGNYLSQSGGVIDPLTNGPTITLLGNWTNNAGNIGFGFDGSNVVFAGAAQSINGSNFTHFYNVTLLGSGTKTLNVQTRVGGFGGVPNGVLSLGSRPLDLNGFDLWVFNPAAGAITNTTGYIQSETNASLNPSQVRWFIGTNTGARTIPFGVAGTQIPLTINTTVALPTSVSYFIASTRATAASDNLPWSSTVTHMFDPTLMQDGSDEAVIDRWWDITYDAATTADVTFSYRGSENTMIVPYNTGNVGAQWWGGAWYPDNANIGSAPAVLAGVGSVTASGLSFSAATYTPWVLSSLSAPLPIELVGFNASCENDKEIIRWTTATETNNDYFTIERSDDGATFYAAGTVSGNGTTTQLHTYSFTDPQPVRGNCYYRLRQTDYNGQNTVSPPIVAEKCGTDNAGYIDAFSSGGLISIVTNLSDDVTYKAEVYDAQGKLVISRDLSASAGENRFIINSEKPATGIYMISITGNDGTFFTKKLYLAAE
jgi:hypothetical protein